MSFNAMGKGRFTMQALMDFGGRFIYRDNREDNAYNRVCSKQMDTTMRSFIIKMITIYVSLSFGLFGPVYAYFTRGIKTTTTEMRIPLCEPKSNAEFMGNFVLQSMIAGSGILVYFGMETFLSLFEDVVAIAPKLVKTKLDDAIQLYEKESISDVELRSRVIQSVEMSIDADG